MYNIPASSIVPSTIYATINTITKNSTINNKLSIICYYCIIIIIIIQKYRCLTLESDGIQFLIEKLKSREWPSFISLIALLDKVTQTAIGMHKPWKKIYCAL
jgi:hypothetical protein